MSSLRLGWVVVALAVASLAVAPGSGHSRERVRAADFTITKSGPATITLPIRTVPAPFEYTITVRYTGTGPGPAAVVLTDVLPREVHFRGTGAFRGTVLAVPGAGEEGGTFSARLVFSPQERTNVIAMSVRPWREGTLTNTATLETGERSTATTVVTREARPPGPPAPPPPPPPPPGPPAAPAQTIDETLAAPGEAVPHTAAISPRAKTVQVALAWADPSTSFDVTGIRIVPARRAVARALAAAAAPPRLKVSKRRTARTLDVRIRNVRPGRLMFRVVARKVSSPTRVVGKVRQSRR